MELCHSPSTKAHTHVTRKLSGSIGKGDAVNNANEHPDASKTNPTEGFLPTASQAKSKQDIAMDNENRTTSQSSFSRILEEPATIDHKSFIQNVFNSVAFKVVEWLAPGNFEVPTTSGDNLVGVEDSTSSPENLEKSQSGTQVPGQSEALDKTEGQAESDHGDNNSHQDKQDVIHSPSSITCNNIPDGDGHGISSENHVPLRRSSSTLRSKIPTCISQLPKEVISTSTMINPSDTKLDKKSLSRDRRPSQIVRRLSQKEIPSSPHIDTAPPTRDTRSTTSPSIQDKLSETSDMVPKEEFTKTLKDIRRSEKTQTKNEHKKSILKPRESVRLPQSLSHMTIEVMDLIYNILQSDGTSERHFLHPQKISDDLKHHQKNSVALARRPLYPAPSIYPHSLRTQWHLFIEQAVFDVFHKPESLLLSFSKDGETLWDSQSIWYAMLLMTRATPSLVFHGLWIALRALFLPPEEIVYKSELLKDPTPHVNPTSGAISDTNAARIISICLHALVAAAPVVLSERQLGNMSRIRSKGLVLDDLELPSLCLQYEDTFTDKLALRLARRIFGAIPTRQSFAESKKHQQAAYGKADSNMDILQTILETMKTADLGVSPLFDFSDSESRLHEKRVPFLVLDWARTVLVHEWDGAAEIPSNGPSGGALAMIAALCMILKLP